MSAEREPESGAGNSPADQSGALVSFFCRWMIYTFECAMIQVENDIRDALRKLAIAFSSSSTKLHTQATTTVVRLIERSDGLYCITTYAIMRLFNQIIAEFNDAYIRGLAKLTVVSSTRLHHLESLQVVFFSLTVLLSGISNIFLATSPPTQCSAATGR